MKTIRVVPDIGCTSVQVVKLICDCGWTEKFFELEHKSKAEAHLLSKHNGGTIKMNGDTREVKAS